MKKLIRVLLVVAVAMFASQASAATKLLPKGAKVSTSVSSDGMAQITVSGVDLERIEYYAHEGVKNLSGSKTTIDLREGRRFQVVFGGGFYALLTPEMAAKPRPDFFGSGVGLDCSNSGGCSFIVTGN